MMDIEKLIEQLKYYGTTYAIGDNLGKEIDGSDELMLSAATVLSTLQAENGRLRVLSKLGNMRAKDYRVMRDRAVKAEAENEKLRAELEQVKRERDAAIEDIWVPKWISCKNGENCSFISAITGMIDCIGCKNWEWRGPQKED